MRTWNFYNDHFMLNQKLLSDLHQGDDQSSVQNTQFRQSINELWSQQQQQKRLQDPNRQTKTPDFQTQCNSRLMETNPRRLITDELVRSSEASQRHRLKSTRLSSSDSSSVSINQASSHVSFNLSKSQRPDRCPDKVPRLEMEITSEDVIPTSEF